MPPGHRARLSFAAVSPASTAGRLAERKGNRTIAVCLPALNEESTVGAICAEVRRTLMPPAAGLVDDLLVVDGNSTDRTGAVATAAGARVVPADDVLPEAGPGFGQGERPLEERGRHDGRPDRVV